MRYRSEETANNTSKLKYDPNEYARKRQMAQERAVQLRNRIKDGSTALDEECTFSPKVNKNARVNSRRASQDNNSAAVDTGDALDQFSRGHPGGKRTPRAVVEDYTPAEVNPEEDMLSTEVKKRTGKPIPNATSQQCLRNSSCRCSQCAMEEVPVRAFQPVERPSSRRQNRDVREDVADIPPRSGSATSGMGQLETMPPGGQGNLSLLKSKLRSRRKTRSAPGNSTVLLPSDPAKEVRHSPRQNAQPRRGRRAPEPVQNAPATYESPAPTSHSIGESAFPGVNIENEVDDDGASFKCDDCGRTFNQTAFPKHQKICKKVFVAKRKAFNATSMRVQGTEAEKILKEQKQKSKPKAATEQPIKAKQAASWKSQSEKFRQAMRGSREVSKAIQSGKPLPPPVASEPDPDLVKCTTCSRTFNEKAAERHMKHCAESSRRNADRLGNARKANSKTAEVSKPTRSRSKR